MRIGLQLLCGLVLIFALAAWFVLEIFVEEIKPGVRSATEDTLVDMAQMLAPLALDDLQEGKMADGRLASAFARLNQSPINALIDGHLKQQAEYRIYVVDRWGKVVYDSDGVDLGKDYSRWNDVYRTLRGEYGARSTRSDPDDPASSVMHVAAPLREGDNILGSLTVAKPNRTLLPMIERSEHQLLQGAALLLFISLLIGALLVWWLNRAIGKLVHYADAVSQGQPASLPRLYSPELDRLGRSLETMRRQLDGKAYIEAYVHSLTHELKSPLAAIRGAGGNTDRGSAAGRGKALYRQYQSGNGPHAAVDRTDAAAGQTGVGAGAGQTGRRAGQAGQTGARCSPDPGPAPPGDPARRIGGGPETEVGLAAGGTSTRQPAGQRPRLLSHRRHPGAERGHGGGGLLLPGAGSGARHSGLRPAAHLRALLFAAQTRQGQEQRPRAQLRHRGGTPARWPADPRQPA